MRVTILFAALALAGCNEETQQRINFSNCVNGVTSPEYAEVLKSCAEAAKRAQAQKQGSE